MNQITKFLAVFAVLATLFTFSNAGTLQVNDINRSQIVGISYNGSNETVYAGAFNTRYEGDSRSYLSFCADLDHNQYVPGTSSVTVGNKNTVNNGGLLANLLTKYGKAVDTNEGAAALQLAVWDLWADGGDGLTTGNFQTTGTYSSTQTLADYFINGAKQPVNAANLIAYNVNRVPGENTQGQNLVRAVPEPTGLIAIGLGAVGMLRKRRKDVGGKAGGNVTNG